MQEISGVDTVGPANDVCAYTALSRRFLRDKTVKFARCRSDTDQRNDDGLEPVLRCRQCPGKAGQERILSLLEQSIQSQAAS